jgi:hypothetical protein
VSRRQRIAAYGTGGATALAGVLCGVLVSGETGQLLAIALLSIGLGGIVLLVFLEIGLSEDRERAAEEARRRRKAQRDVAPPPWRRRLPRRRGD